MILKHLTHSESNILKITATHLREFPHRGLTHPSAQPATVFTINLVYKVNIYKKLPSDISSGCPKRHESPTAVAPKTKTHQAKLIICKMM